MQPIGPLMHEHRLIERMVALVQKQAVKIEQGGRPDFEFVAGAVEFFRTYADQCHHGKEEDLLFKELAEKNLTNQLSDTMAELIEEHKQGRRMVGELEQANRDCRDTGTGQDKVMDLLNTLAEFYPRHIEKEDKHFFFPVMEYFSREEMDSMLADFAEFDRLMIHEFFIGRVKAWEKGA